MNTRKLMIEGTVNVSDGVEWIQRVSPQVPLEAWVLGVRSRGGCLAWKHGCYGREGVAMEERGLRLSDMTECCRSNIRFTLSTPCTVTTIDN